MFASFERKHWLLEAMALLSFIAMLVFFMLNWQSIGDTTPTHFGFNGTIDAWANKEVVLTIPVLALAVFLAMTAIEMMPKFWQIPQADEGKESAGYASRTLTLLILLKLIMVLVFFAVLFWIIAGADLPPWFMALIFAILAGGMIVAVISLHNYRRQVPEKAVCDEDR